MRVAQEQNTALYKKRSANQPTCSCPTWAPGETWERQGRQSGQSGCRRGRGRWGAWAWTGAVCAWWHCAGSSTAATGPRPPGWGTQSASAWTQQQRWRSTWMCAREIKQGIRCIWLLLLVSRWILMSYQSIGCTGLPQDHGQYREISIFTSPQPPGGKEPKRWVRTHTHARTHACTHTHTHTHL